MNKSLVRNSRYLNIEFFISTTIWELVVYTDILLNVLHRHGCLRYLLVGKNDQMLCSVNERKILTT